MRCHRNHFTSDFFIDPLVLDSLYSCSFHIWQSLILVDLFPLCLSLTTTMSKVNNILILKKRRNQQNIAMQYHYLSSICLVMTICPLAQRCNCDTVTIALYNFTQWFSFLMRWYNHTWLWSDQWWMKSINKVFAITWGWVIMTMHDIALGLDFLGELLDWIWLTWMA